MKKAETTTTSHSEFVDRRTGADRPRRRSLFPYPPNQKKNKIKREREGEKKTFIGHLDRVLTSIKIESHRSLWHRNISMQSFLFLLLLLPSRPGNSSIHSSVHEGATKRTYLKKQKKSAPLCRSTLFAEAEKGNATGQGSSQKNEIILKKKRSNTVDEKGYDHSRHRVETVSYEDGDELISMFENQKENSKMDK